MNYEDVLIEPVMTEKATLLREEGKYVFKVHPDASKIEIKEAVRRLFNVKVVTTRHSGSTMPLLKLSIAL